jgi:hypothetical protein
MVGGVRKLLVACVLGTAPAALAAQVLDSSLRIAAEERYDDDLRFSTTGGGELMTKLSPRLGLELKDPRSKGEAFYATDLVIRHGSGSASIDHRGGLEVNYALSRRLQLDFTSRIYRVTDPTSLPRDGVARTLAPTLYGQARVSAAVRATRRLDVRGSYAFEGAKVYEDGNQAGFAHTPSVEAWYRNTRRMALGLEYRYQGFLYGDDLSQAHGAFAGLRYRLSRLTTLTMRGGPVRHTSPEGQAGWLPRVSVGLDREGQLFDLGFAVGHDLVGSSTFDHAVWSDYASLAIARRFNDRLAVNAAASYFRNGPAPNEGAFTLSNSPLMSQGYAVECGVEYRLNRYLELQGTVNRIAQVGTGGAAAGVDLARNVLAVRLVISAW